RQKPAQYNSSRTDGRIDPGVLHNTANRSGRQITGDRMTVLSWAVPPVLALSKEERLFIWIGVFAGVILVGAAILSRVDRWKKRQLKDWADPRERLGSSGER